MLYDLRLAVRTLAKAPAFTFTTLVVLALGIGVNTAIFGLVNQVLLRPPGIANPERIAAIRVKYRAAEPRQHSRVGARLPRCRAGHDRLRVRRDSRPGRLQLHGRRRPRASSGRVGFAALVRRVRRGAVLGSDLSPRRGSAEREHGHGSRLRGVAAAVRLRSVGCRPHDPAQRDPLQDRRGDEAGLPMACQRGPVGAARAPCRRVQRGQPVQ